MKAVIQRVLEAGIVIENRQTARIGKGLLIFLGIHQNDTRETAEKLAQKIFKIRLFADGQKPINASLSDINGEVLIVSQFTLYADLKGQNRPSFIAAAKPDLAHGLYAHFVSSFKGLWPKVQTGQFAADMQVSLVNDGPVTIVLDTGDF